MAQKFTRKQQMFVAEYLASWDATKVAIKAGYSAKSAESQGCQLLKLPKVAAEIDRRTQKTLAKLEITADRVLSELAKLAFFDPRTLFNNDGTPKNICELDGNAAAAISGLDVQELYPPTGKTQAGPIATIKKIRLADKGQNLERIGRHLKMFTDKVEVSTSLHDLSDEQLRERLEKLEAAK